MFEGLLFEGLIFEGLMFEGLMVGCLALGKQKEPLVSGSWLRRAGSNHRPSGYEPDELPLLYSAIQLNSKSDLQGNLSIFTTSCKTPSDCR